MSTFQLKQNDLEPAFAATLYNGTDPLTRLPVDLTLATGVVFIMKRKGVVLINRTMVVGTPATSGNVTMAWQTGDTATPGTYQAEIEVTWPSARPQTFPANGTITVYVEAELA